MTTFKTPTTLAEARITAADKSIQDFTKKLEDGSPGERFLALHWSMNQFAAVAEQVVWTEIKAMAEMKVPVPVEDMIDFARDRAVEYMRHPSHSSLPTANLIEESVGTAWAKAADDLRWVRVGEQSGTEG